MRVALQPIELASASVLSGCAPSPPPAHEDALASATRICLDRNRQVVDARDCFLSRDARQQRFMKLGDGLAWGAVAGKPSDAEGQRRLTAGLPAEGVN